MSSPRKDQAQGSEHTEQAPGPDPTVQGTHQTGQALGSSDPTEQVQGTHQTGQVLGSSDPTEQVQGTHQASGASTPEYESVIDDMEPPKVRKARLELERDPDYNPQADEVIIPCLLLHDFMFSCLYVIT